VDLPVLTQWRSKIVGNQFILLHVIPLASPLPVRSDKNSRQQKHCRSLILHVAPSLKLVQSDFYRVSCDRAVPYMHVVLSEFNQNGWPSDHETMSHDSIAFWKQRGLGRIRTRSLQRRRKCRRTLRVVSEICLPKDRSTCSSEYSAASTKWVISTWAGAKEASEGWRFDVVEIRLWW